MKIRPALCSLALAVCTAACSQQNPNNPSPGPSPSPGTSTVSYTAIGASDAIGIGSSSFCIPFAPCPDGKGYVQLIARRFTADGKTLTHLNLSLPGAVLGPTVEALGDSLGREIIGNFLERLVPFVARDSTVVTVFAGANDVNTVGSAVDAGLGGSNPSAYIATHIQTFGRDLRSMVSGIRDRAPSARIVVLNLPNMAGMPYVSGLSVAQKRLLLQIAVGFSAEINALTSLGVLVVDLMCEASMYSPSIYSSDGFHPSDTGYARMADMIYPPASTGVGTAPRASCSQMTLF